MSLDQDVYLPDVDEGAYSEDEVVKARFFKDFLTALKDMYSGIVTEVNGTIEDFDPVVIGLTTAGTGTYSFQTGTYRNQGGFVNYWFDVSWTAHTGTGVLGLILPFPVAQSDNDLWVNPLQTIFLTYPVGYTSAWINCIENTETASVLFTGTGVASSTINVPGTGEMRGHVSYLSQGE